MTFFCEVGPRVTLAELVIESVFPLVAVLSRVSFSRSNSQPTAPFRLGLQVTHRPPFGVSRATTSGTIDPECHQDKLLL